MLEMIINYLMRFVTGNYPYMLKISISENPYCPIVYKEKLVLAYHVYLFACNQNNFPLPYGNMTLAFIPQSIYNKGYGQVMAYLKKQDIKFSIDEGLKTLFNNHIIQTDNSKQGV